MKKAIKSIALLILSALAFSGCEKDVWEENNLVLTPIYYITNATVTNGSANVSTDNSSMTELTVYYKTGQVILWENSSTVIRCAALDDFEESSTDELYDFTFEELCSEDMKISDEEIVEVTRRRTYTITGDVEAGTGEMVVTEYNGTESTYSVTIAATTRTTEPTE